MSDPVTGISTGVKNPYSVVVSVFDSSGRFQVNLEGYLQSSYDTPSTVDTTKLGVIWNGKNASGESCPTGRYFYFWQVRDSVKVLVRTDSSCIFIHR